MEAMLTKLLLLRHASTEWARPGESDFDRVLRKRGQIDSQRMAEALRGLAIFPDLIVCSPARRALETLEYFLPALAPPAPTVVTEEELYGSDAAGYLRIVHSAPPAECLMLVGHNPMMEDLATELTASGEADALALLERGGFPTCGLAILSFSTPLAEIGRRSGHLDGFLTPKGLEREAPAIRKASDPWQG